jgi:AcrR family transcriptional regulator
MSKTHDQTPNRYFHIKRFRDRLQGKEGQILLGAFKSIVEVGVSGTTIRAIGAKADLNPGIFHYYFKSKDHLLTRLLEVLYENSIANVEALLATTLSPMEKMDALFNLGLSLSGNRMDEWTVITSFWAHSMSTNNSIRSYHRKLNRRFRASMTKIVQEVTSDFRFGTSKDFALFIVGVMEGLALQYVLDPKGFSSEKFVNLLREVIRVALGKRK